VLAVASDEHNRLSPQADKALQTRPGAVVSSTDETLEDAYRTGARRVLDDCDRDYWQLAGSSAHAV
jgi:hypothetical protein